MKKHIKAVLILLVLLLSTTDTAKAAESPGAYFYLENDNGWYSVKLEPEFYGEFTTGEKAYIIFDTLLQTRESNILNFIPEGTELISIGVKDGHLYLDVTGGITAYGGNFWETYLIEQLEKTAFSIEGIDAFTLLIDGLPSELPEGTALINIERNP